MLQGNWRSFWKWLRRARVTPSSPSHTLIALYGKEHDLAIKLDGQGVVSKFSHLFDILMDFPGLKALFRTPQTSLQSRWLFREPVFLFAFLSRQTSPWLFIKKKKKDLFPLFLCQGREGVAFIPHGCGCHQETLCEHHGKESVGVSSACRFVSLR